MVTCTCGQCSSAAGRGGASALCSAGERRTACKLVVELQQTTGPLVLYWAKSAGEERKMLDSRSAPDPSRLTCNSYLGDTLVLRRGGCGALLRRITLRATEATKEKEIYYPYSERYFCRVAVRDGEVSFTFSEDEIGWHASEEEP